MKENPRRLRSVVLMVLLAGASFVGGYVLRAAAGGEGSDARSSQASESKAQGTGIAERSGRAERSAKQEDGSSSGKDRLSLDTKVLHAMRMKDPVDRIVAFLKELDGMTPENAAAYVEALGKADPKGNRKLEWQALWRRWAALDPIGSARYAKELPGELGQFAIDMVINKWTETDPGAAYDYIVSLGDGEFHDTALYSYIGRVGTSDLDAALTIADRALKSNPEEYNRSMERLHGEFLFANQGGDSREFFKLLKSDEAKNAAFGHVLFRLMNNSPDQAGDWLVEQRSYASDRAVKEVERRKNGANPGSGTEWRNANFPEVAN